MCDEPVPCACTLERRAQLRDEARARSNTLSDLAYRLRKAEQISEGETMFLYAQAEAAWDDAIHIAATDDPLRSLCGLYGRNLTDLPERPGGGEGCWTCLHKADELAAVEQQKELVPA